VAVALGLGSTEGQSITAWIRIAYDKVFFVFLRLIPWLAWRPILFRVVPICL